MSKMRPLIPAIFMLAVLSSCGTTTPAPQETPTPPEMPTATLGTNVMGTPELAVDASLPMVTLTPTSTPRPTSALPPGEIIYAATQTAEVLSWRARITEIARFPQPGRDCENFPALSSPDGNWLASRCQVDGGNLPAFVVTNRDNSVTWIVPYQEMVPDWNDPMHNPGSVRPIFWSPDSHYVYFVERRCCWDGPPIIQNSYDADLNRLDVQTGEWREIILGSIFNYYSFSPTGRRLVFIREYADPLVMIVYDLQTGGETTIALGPYEQAGYLVWSPDGLKLAITVANPGEHTEYGIYSLLIFDLENDLSQTIISNSGNPCFPVGWTDAGYLIVRIHQRVSGNMHDLEYHYYNPETYEFTPALVPSP